MNTSLASTPRPPIPWPAARGTERRALLAVALAPFLGALAIAAPPPFFPAMAADLGSGVPLLGQVVTAMLLLGAAFSLLVGPLADRRGHRRLLVLGAVAAAGCLLGFGLAPAYPALLAAAMLGGVANATLPALALAVAGTAFEGAGRRRAIGWATAGGAGAAVIGVPVLAAVGGAAGWRAAFVVAGLAALGGAWLIGAAPAPVVPHATAPSDGRRLLTAYRPLIRHPPMRRLYGTTVLRSLAWSGLLTYLGAFLRDEAGLSSAGIGVAYAAGGLGYVAGSLGAGRLLGRAPARPVVAAANVALALALGLTFAADLGAGGTVALLGLTGVLGAVGWVGVTALLAAESPAGAGMTMALNGALSNLGAAGGGAIGGVLLTAGGYTALAIGLPACAVVAAALVARSSHFAHSVGQQCAEGACSRRRWGPAA